VEGFISRDDVESTDRIERGLTGKRPGTQGKSKKRGGVIFVALQQHYRIFQTVWGQVREKGQRNRRGKDPRRKKNR